MNKKRSPSDQFLILQYRKGDISMLSILVKRYHKIFCEKAFWITKDKETAKDIAQDSWIAIINNLHKLKNADSFTSWAFRIIYTKSIDAVKHRNKVNEKIELRGIIESDNPGSKNNTDHIQIALLKAIQDLPKEKQDIIRLFYAEEYSISEISTFLNIPVGTVKSRLFKAREKLKSILNKKYHEN